ncbi:cation transporter [Marinimicrobium alkaliphilum]|uniref:cation transporter n=1 Tax=Marinimicrobium alkaliphilum TaxID=2202654 RepID=UPI000DBAC836|nr:cation transporter [Marinimicrobium alkaliphilum]
MKTEVGALRVSVVMSLVVGGVAVTAATFTNSQAILLDGLFNLVYFAIALATLRVSQLASGPDSDQFPFGYSYFESLVNVGKGLLILGVSGFALFDAVNALLTGGREIVAGLAIAYAAFAALVCSVCAWLMQRTLRHVDSPLVRIDRDNWVINAVFTGVVLLTFCLIPVLQAFGFDTATRYIDSVLVIVVVLFFLGVPVRMANQALQELLNRTPPEPVAAPVRAAIEAALVDLPEHTLYVRMVKPGRLLYVIVHVVLPADYRPDSLASLDRVREQIDKQVRAFYAPLVTDVIFTTEERWAAPSSGLLSTNSSV